jgi:hypothetical protein
MRKRVLHSTSKCFGSQAVVREILTNSISLVDIKYITVFQIGFTANLFDYIL